MLDEPLCEGQHLSEDECDSLKIAITNQEASHLLHNDRQRCYVIEVVAEASLAESFSQLCDSVLALQNGIIDVDLEYREELVKEQSQFVFRVQLGNELIYNCPPNMHSLLVDCSLLLYELGEEKLYYNGKYIQSVLLCQFREAVCLVSLLLIILYYLGSVRC